MARITLTGVDERTPLDRLVQLTKTYPQVELAVLFTETPEGRNRYPSINWVAEFISAVGQQAAIHLCGRASVESVLDGCYPLFQSVGRLQVNGKITEEELRQFLALPYEETERLYGFTTVITQWSRRNTSLLDVDIRGHCLLVDTSGGRGISPELWERPITSKPVGFAGGLSYSNFHLELPKIQVVAVHPWWVDMEASLRTEDDWFSIEIAERTVERFLELVERFHV